MGRIVCILVCALRLWGQHAELRIYTEFDRLNESGELIEAVPGRTPQEIISPAAVRNGFTSFHVAVSGRPGILYWFAVQSNPANVFGIRVYKEFPAASAAVLDGLREEVKPLYFLGVMPPGGKDVYLLDIWAPADTPVRTVRLEVLVKEAYWVVAPMEVRIQEARVPRLNPRLCCISLASPDLPADIFAWAALLTGFTEEQLPYIPCPANVRSVLLRNAIQDAALIRSMPSPVRTMLLNRVLAEMLRRFVPGLLSASAGADVYLPIRRQVMKLAADNGVP